VSRRATIEQPQYQMAVETQINHQELRHGKNSAKKANRGNNMNKLSDGIYQQQARNGDVKHKHINLQSERSESMDCDDQVQNGEILHLKKTNHSSGKQLELKYA